MYCSIKIVQINFVFQIIDWLLVFIAFLNKFVVLSFSRESCVMHTFSGISFLASTTNFKAAL